MATSFFKNSDLKFRYTSVSWKILRSSFYSFSNRHRILHISTILRYLNLPFSFISFTDYAVAVFHEGLLNRRYECYLEPHTMLPMIYIEDCLSALFQFLNTPDKLLRRRVYNVTAMSFTPEELFKELLKYIPDLKITYKPDKRQYIGM